MGAGEKYTPRQTLQSKYTHKTLPGWWKTQNDEGPNIHSNLCVIANNPFYFCVLPEEKDDILWRPANVQGGGGGWNQNLNFPNLPTVPDWQSIKVKQLTLDYQVIPVVVVVVWGEC